MSKAAQFGRGTHTNISDLSQVNKKMADLFEKITSPVMRDIEVSWSNNPSVEVYPSKIPDLYNGQPLTLIAKSASPITQAQIQGELFNTPWTQTLNLQSTQKQQTDNLDTIWARQKVASIMDELRTGNRSLEQARNHIIKLGVEHNIVTKYTSFIAVETTPSKPAHVQAKHKSVPNLMPKGNTMPAPQTASPVTLLYLLGVLFVLLSYGIKKYAYVRQLMTVMSYQKNTNLED